MTIVHSKTIVLFFSVIIGLPSLPRAYAFEATDRSADKHGALTVDGYSRSYTIHIPPNVGRRPPVVFMLHGRGGTKEQAAGEFGWRELADRERFMVVFPQALPIIPDLALDTLTPASVPSWLGSTNFTIWWSSGFARNLPALHHPDDGVFLTRLIAKIVDDEHVDPYRVHIAGFSSGGGMVADLAARYPKIARAFAAIASIGGLHPSKLTAPVSLLLLQEDADSTAATGLLGTDTA